MGRWLPAAGLAVILAPALAGCTEFDGAAAPDPAPTSSEPAPTEPTTSAPATETPSATPSPTSSPSTAEPLPPAGGLRWRPVPGPADTSVTVSGRWRLSVPAGGGGAALDGPRRLSVPVPDGFRVTDAFIDGQDAVVVSEHEAARRPNVARVIDLASGRTTTLDGGSEVPTTIGGSWALGSGLLVHPTVSRPEYCLAVVDLLAGRSRRGPCVPPRNGISNVRVTPAGTTAMTFDDSRPACRTLNRVEGTRFVPIRGVDECHGWEAVATETMTVWGEVEDERRIEASRFFVDLGRGRAGLGPGTTGTLTWCGDAAYFVRDPQRSGDPARLMRVDPTGRVETVYRSPGRGNAFIEAPRCGGTDLTITAFGAAGDEQVTTPVG